LRTASCDAPLEADCKQTASRLKAHLKLAPPRARAFFFFFFFKTTTLLSFLAK
jgi:hypothetical protein